MSTAITDDDDFTTTPDGPSVAEARTSALIRLYLGKVNNRVRWLFNRLAKTLLGPFSTFAPGAIDTVADTITIMGHGLATDDLVRFGNVGGTMLSVGGVALDNNAGLSSAAYYVIAVDPDTIQIKATVAGLALDLTAIGTGTHYLFAVPSALKTIVHPTFTPTFGAAAVPAGSLFQTLTSYYLSTKGGLMAGPIYLGGASAKVIARTSAGNLPSIGNADLTITTFEDYGHWRCVDQSANHAFTLPDPTEAGLVVRVSRVDFAGGFGATFKRTDASTIGSLAAVGWIDFLSYDSGDGKGLAWHGCGGGGASAIS